MLAFVGTEKIQANVNNNKQAPKFATKKKQSIIIPK